MIAGMKDVQDQRTCEIPLKDFPWKVFLEASRRFILLLR